MENDNRENKNFIIIIGIVLIVIILIIFLPGIIKEQKKLETSKLEYKLLQEGKTINSDEIIKEIVEILKDRDEEKLKEYLSSDFKYWNNNNIESKYIYNFWSDLKFYTGKHYIEERGDTLNQENKTFWIYWDIPEQLEYKQYSQYSLQKICIYMRRIVKEDIITYEITQMILKNN